MNKRRNQFFFKPGVRCFPTWLVEEFIDHQESVDARELPEIQLHTPHLGPFPLGTREAHRPKDLQLACNDGNRFRESHSEGRQKSHWTSAVGRRHHLAL